MYLHYCLYAAGKIKTKPFCYNTELPNDVMLSYRIVILFVQYVVPLCIISWVYARIALRVWGSHAPGNAQYIRDATLMKNKMKVSDRYDIYRIRFFYFHFHMKMIILSTCEANCETILMIPVVIGRHAR